MIGTILKETLKGKSISRTLANVELFHWVIEGTALDVGGGGVRASHYRFLKLDNKAHLVTVNLDKESKPDFLLDIETNALPVKDELYDAVLCFNTLEHVYYREHVVAEMYRVLKRGGMLLGSMPFLVNVHPDPYDYGRLTQQGIEKLLGDVGFRNITITPVGRGPFTAAYAHLEFVAPRILRVLKIPVVFFLDWLLEHFTPSNLRERYPLAYVFSAEK